MHSSLLLEKSNIFSGSCLIDDIHQSYIDINQESNEESIQSLVIEAFNILSAKELQDEIANEVFLLIRKCFKYFSKILLPIFGSLFDESKINSNRIIITVIVLKDLIYHHPDLELPDCSLFINDVINEIRSQIQNNDISVFNIKIQCRFQYILIINILLCSNMTMEIISDFLPYIFSANKISDYHSLLFFVQKLSEKDLIKTFPDSIINNFELLKQLNIQILGYLIPYISDQIFIQNFPTFDSLLINSDQSCYTYMINIIKKCLKLKLKLNQKITNIFSELNWSDVTPEIFEYLNQYNFTIYPTDVQQMSDCPYIYILIEKFSTISIFSEEKLIQILKKKTSIENDDLTSSNFYNQIYSFYNNNKISLKLIEIITILLKKFISKEKFNQIINEMIFSVYPPTSQGSYFLTQFFDKIDDEYKNMFYSKENMNHFIFTLLDKKVTPIQDFVKIIDRKFIYEIIQETKNNSPLLLYFYYFSSSSQENLDSIEITVLPQTNPDDENLINCIKDDRIFVNFNDECLSFVMSALIFSKSANKTVINGLTKETILQFYSIVSHFSDGSLLIDKISTQEMISLLIEGINSVSNNHSQIITFSIDIILTSLKFSDDIKKQILEILIKFLLNGEYFATNLILIKKLLNNHQFIQLQLYELFEYIFDHCPNMNFFGIYLSNKNDIYNNKLEKIIVDRLESSSLTLPNFLTIYHFINNCFNNIKIRCSNEIKTNLFRIFDEIINEYETNEHNKSLELIQVCRFIVRNGLMKELHEKINNENNISESIKCQVLSNFPLDELNTDEIISLIDEKYDDADDEFYGELFDLMMKDKMNRIGYFLCKLEKFRNKFIFSPEELLTSCFFDFIEYKDDFIEALDHAYVLDPNQNIFVIRAKFKKFNYSQSELTSKILTKIYQIIEDDSLNYCPFLLLKSIASSFPFIFQDNPQKIIDIVLPKLKYFYLMYEKNFLDNDEMFDTAFTALSFLHSTLISSKTLDYFMNWYFTHYRELNPSQLYCFNLLLLSILMNNQTSAILFLLKNNVFDYFSYLLSINVDDKYFNINFNYIVYTLIYHFHLIILEKNENLKVFSALYDEYSKIDDTFSFYNEYYLINSFDKLDILRNRGLFIFPIELEQKEEILDFMDMIEEQRSFWINYVNDETNQITSDQINSFIEQYKKMINIPEFNINTFTNLNINITKKILIYSSMQPRWAQLILFHHLQMPICSEHQQILTNLINNISKIEKTGKLSDDDTTEDCPFESFKDYSILMRKIFNENFLQLIIAKVKSFNNNEPKYHLYKTIQILSSISLNTKAMISMIFKQLNLYESQISINEIIEILKSLKEIIKQILNLCSRNPASISNVSLPIVSSLILAFSEPSFFQYENLFDSIYDLLNCFTELPNRATHLIGFMLISNNDSIISNAISLCTKFTEDNLKNIKHIIENVFSNEINSKSPRIKIISAYITYLPNIAKTKMRDLMQYLMDLMTKYESNLKLKNNDENESLSDFIIELLDFLTPTRDDSFSFCMSDSISSKERKQNPNYKFYPIPQFIFDSSKEFWQFFEDHRQIIDFIYLQKIKEDFVDLLLTSKIINQYPECFSFEFRMTYFRHKMMLKIDDDKIILLEINRNKIFEDSFNQLITKQPNELFSYLKIKYINEIGQDAGGLTKDWFTQISTELFNPQSDLFKCLDNFNYIIKPNNDKSSLEKFKFAGLIVAFALIQDEFINANLAKSFLKQILHHKINLKDLEEVDSDLFKNLQSLLDQDLDSDSYLEIYFEKYDDGKTIELTENGSNIKVTNQNKQEYIKLYTEYILKKSISNQIEAFCSGFDSLIKHEDIRIFTSSELSLLISGISYFDVDDFIKNVQFDMPYNKETPVVKMFFNVISKWDNQNLIKLLIFITGSARIHKDGFKYYDDIGVPITIAHDPDANHFPVSHTCSNTIDLPEYDNEDVLNQKLLFVIHNVTDFNLA